MRVIVLGLFFLSLGLFLLVLRFDLIGKNSWKRFSLTPMIWRHNRVSRGFLYYARELKCQDICPGERAVVFANAESTKKRLCKRRKAS